MACRNLFEEKFNQVTESRQLLENVRTKLIEGVQELSELKKVCNVKQRELTKTDIEVAKLKDSNKELKITLMQTLIEKLELENRKRFISEHIEELNQKLDALEKNTDDILSGKTAEKFCSKFNTHEQCSLMNKIQDATCKLIEYGFQPYSY